MRIALHCFSLVLDAMPWPAVLFAELTKLADIPWTLTFVEGAAMNVKDTRWMNAQPPRLSGDGTSEFLDAMGWHPRIRVMRRERWDGKIEMCNAALPAVPGVLMQVDGDEVWVADQLRRIVELFEDDPKLMLARFHCRYFVGANLVTTDAGKPDEWLRAWRYAPGMKWVTHEPPNLAGNVGKSLSRVDTAAMGLVFDHFAYALPKHVEMKEKLYPRMAGALEGWKAMQANTEWPLRDAGVFLPGSFKGVPVDQVFKP